MTVDQLPINLFDVIFAGMLIGGIARGRKKGMSEELLSLLQWVSIVVVCSIAYQPVGRFLYQNTSMFSMLSCYLMAYITLALLILGIFALIHRGIGGKLLGSDIFGPTEYYLGMGSGLVRFSCMLIAALALLNARAYSEKEIRDMENFQNREFGSNYFPTMQSIQATVFKKSLAGAWLHDNISFLLIQPTAPENKEFKQKEFTYY